jgi:hypothetical protein
MSKLHKVHVYAALTKWGKTNLFVTAGTAGFKSESKGVTAKVYVKLLEDKPIPARRQLMECRPMPLRDQRWVFQQDNTPTHTAKITQAWLHIQSDFTVIDWLPTNPQLSWIDNVWGIVTKQLQARTDVTARNFEDAVFEEWVKLPQSAMRALYTSIRRMLTACLAEKGGSTKY